MGRPHGRNKSEDLPDEPKYTFKALGTNGLNGKSVKNFFHNQKTEVFES
jgi:hypothetical protein